MLGRLDGGSREGQSEEKRPPRKVPAVMWGEKVGSLQRTPWWLNRTIPTERKHKFIGFRFQWTVSLASSSTPETHNSTVLRYDSAKCFIHKYKFSSFAFSINVNSQTEFFPSPPFPRLNLFIIYFRRQNRLLVWIHKSNITQCANISVVGKAESGNEMKKYQITQKILFFGLGSGLAIKKFIGKV